MNISSSQNSKLICIINLIKFHLRSMEEHCRLVAVSFPSPNMIFSISSPNSLLFTKTPTTEVKNNKGKTKTTGFPENYSRINIYIYIYMYRTIPYASNGKIPSEILSQRVTEDTSGNLECTIRVRVRAREN